MNHAPLFLFLFTLLISQSDSEGFCERNAQCVESDTTCINGTCLPHSAMNDPCDDAKDCIDPNLRCIHQQCSPRSEVGGACHISLDDRDCVDQLVCMNATCARRSARGGACVYYWHCENDLSCVSNVCTGRSHNGGKCETNIDCQSSFCRNSICVSGEAKILLAIFILVIIGIMMILVIICVWHGRKIVGTRRIRRNPQAQMS